MKYFFANWKMYLKESEALALAKVVKTTPCAKCFTVAVFPSAIHLRGVKKILGSRPCGVQDVGHVEYGAATGETSAFEAKKMGAKYTLVGHSERRRAGENDLFIAKKFAVALKAGLIPVLCVGETEEERKSGHALDVVLEQLESSMREAGELLKTKDFIVAYEPVWAIGTSISAKPSEVSEMHLVIHKELSMIVGEKGVKTPILYGGSVTANNVAEYLALPAVSGVLVGGASTKAKEFKALIKALC
ncbi:MAG: triose-phosphate isomerase [bacterium]